MDENEYYERFLLPEMVSRSTCNLTFVTFQHDPLPVKSSTERPTIKNMIDCFSKFARLYHLHDLPTLLYSDRAKDDDLYIDSLFSDDFNSYVYIFYLQAYIFFLTC